MGKQKEEFKDKDIKAKLRVMTNALLVLLLILGAAALLGAWRLNKATTELGDNWMIANNMIAEMDYLSSEYRMKQYAHIVTEREELWIRAEQELEEIDRKLDVLIEEYASTISSERDRQLYEVARTAWENYKTNTTKEVFRLSKAHKTEEAGELMLGEGYEYFMEFQAHFDELLNYNIEGANAANHGGTITFYVVLIIIVSMIFISYIIGTRVSKMIIDGISGPVDELKNAAAEMVKGNLSTVIEYEAKDELGELADSIREVQKTLGEYIREISEILSVIAQGDLTLDVNQITDFRGEFSSIKKSFVMIFEEFNLILSGIHEAASDVDSGSDEIASAASELANGTGDQASAVEELTATISTISSMAESAARETDEACKEARTAVEEAEEEQIQMARLKEEMKRIKEISGEIEAIITSIEEIASQTSLLSLNASIEAARAGEAGRGFAVVADQIGKLATDSAHAVVNTKELIGKTVEAIDKGSYMTEKTVEGFEHIIHKLEAIAERVQLVNESSLTQSKSLNQVEVGIEQISEVTQQNAASSEQCSAISEELSARATEMNGRLQNFKLCQAK